ncbi:FHA domain-containing protein [Patescibacteria group bacterium]
MKHISHPDNLEIDIRNVDSSRPWGKGQLIIGTIKSLFGKILGKEEENQDKDGEENEVKELLTFSAEQKKLLKILFPKGIENSHFRQSTDVGDCYLLAPLHAIKFHPIAPYVFVNMFSRDADGWVVRFGNGEAIRVFFSELGGSGKSYFDHGKQENVFINAMEGQLGDRLIEIAYGKMRKPQTRYREDNNRDPMTYRALNGGNPEESFEELLGDFSEKNEHLIAFYPGARKEIEKIFLELSLNPHDYLISVGTRKASFLERKYKKGSKFYTDPQHRFVCGHAWAVVAVNHERSEITLSNPHDTKDNVHTISYDDFFSYFHDFYSSKLKKSVLEGIDYFENDNLTEVYDEELDAVAPYRYNTDAIVLCVGNDKDIPCFVKDGKLVLNFGEALESEGDLIIELEQNEERIIGRNEFPELANSISRNHFKIKFTGDQIVVTDLNSSYGTKVFKVHDSDEDEEEALKPPIYLGAYNKELTPGEENEYNFCSPHYICIGKRKMYCYFDGDTLCLHLREISTYGGGFYIYEGQEIVFGRDTVEGLVETISGEHFKIKNLGRGQVIITDMNSTNGTMICLA